MQCVRLFLILSLSLFMSPLFAANYQCQPNYTYSGWLPTRSITLNSTYYRGYGATREEAQQEALFLCQQVYRQCTVDPKHCKTTTQSITHCWVRHGLVDGYHHDRDAAKWVAQHRCQQEHHLLPPLPSACEIEDCAIATAEHNELHMQKHQLNLKPQRLKAKGEGDGTIID